MASFNSGGSPSARISTSSAAAVVPPGDVTFSRKVAAGSAERRDRWCRIRLDDRDPLGCKSGLQPAFEQGAAHLAGAAQNDGACEIVKILV